MEQATESGSTLVLDDTFHANTAYENTAALAKTAPTGPVLGTDSGRSLSRRLSTRRWWKKCFLRGGSEKKSPKSERKGFKYHDVIPKEGCLFLSKLGPFSYPAQYLGLHMTQSICLKRSSFATYITMS